MAKKKNAESTAKKKAAKDKSPSGYQSPEKPIFGVLAEYETPEDLIAASKVVRDAGFQQWDTYTPFPVHGIDPAMGIKRTKLPYFVLVAGLIGFATATALQFWTNGVDYPWLISGKPFISIPASVPIMFELTVLFSALTALGAMLALNKLPEPSHPLHLKRSFDRATDDRFFLLIEAKDPKYDEAEVTALLEGTPADSVEALEDDTETSANLPRGLVYALAILAVAAVVPFAVSAKARATTSRETRIHAVPDMDSQKMFKSQRKNDFFADNRAMRGPVEGTVARGNLQEDDHLYRGKVGGEWARTFPKEIAINEVTMARGKERFDISCGPCHGVDGSGDGMINRRATEIGAGLDGWIPPTNVTYPSVAKQPVGQLYNSVANGVRNMPGYANQLTPEDRWAVVLYIRALQRASNASSTDFQAK